MIITSEAYKNEQKQELREKSYVYIYMGLINQISKDNATVDTSVSSITPYSNIDSAFRDNKHEDVAQYATLEDNFTKVNDTNAFLPRESTYYADNQGIIVSQLNSKVRITFGSASDTDMAGLTIDFGKEYPTAFTITNGTDTHTYTKDDSTLFTCEDSFNECEYLDIIPTTMHGENQRLRILSLEFGMGLSFSNEQIISTQRRNTVSHISDCLPLKAFDFTVSNLSRKFSQDNPKSFSSYIQQGQQVVYNYARDIVDSEGNVTQYTIPGGKTYVKTWSSTNTQAKFSTVGRLDMMDSEYYKGTYNGDLVYPTADERWKSAYDVAEEILLDAGIGVGEYFISDYLKSVRMVNPIPVTTHKAALQMICNYTKSILYEDRDGHICIQSSFMPTSQNLSYIGSTGRVYFDIELFDDNSELYNFAYLEENYTRVDDTMYFTPRYAEVRTKKTGFVTDLDSGDFDVSSNVPLTFYGVVIEFSENIPDAMEMAFYNADLDENEVITIDNVSNYIIKTDNIHKIFKYEERLENVSVIGMSFDTNASQRVHVNHIHLIQESGFTIGNIDLKELPTATSIEHVKNVSINYYSFVPNEEIKQITSATVKDGTNLIKFSNPNVVRGNIGYRYLWDDGTPDWSESATYSIGEFVRFEGVKYRSLINNNHLNRPQPPEYQDPCWQALTNQDLDIDEEYSSDYYTQLYFYSVPVVAGNPCKLLIYAYPYNVTTGTYSEHLHDIGNDMKLANVLVYDRDTKDSNNKNIPSNAADLCGWIKDYLENDTEYTISYRGEPALDCDDLVYLENQFVKNNLCRITEEEISTGVGMSLTNSMKLRRVSYSLE